MLLSLQMGFSFVRAAVACAILERFGAIIWNNYSKVLEACYSTQLLPFYFYLSLDAIGTVCHQFGLLRTDLHLIPCAGSTRAPSSCSFSARASTSSAYRASDMRVTEYTLALLWLLFWTILPCCHSSGLHLQPRGRAAQFCKLDLHWIIVLLHGGP